MVNVAIVPGTTPEYTLETNDQKAGNGKAITDLLHGHTSGTAVSSYFI
jgi:hypothetical protein